MRKKIRWGVLGVASIAVRKVIPGMQKGAFSEVAAIASRDLAKAQTAARDLGLAKAYGSYEALLADPEIDAIYNPLPNHLHVPWSIKAAEAGKHVLCEKPVGCNAGEAEDLVRVRDRTGVKIGEAFMVKTHPQWLRVRELARNGSIGQLKSIVTVFSYFNRDPQNVRHKPEWGGGGLLDVGSYPVTLSRWIFGEEPKARRRFSRTRSGLSHGPAGYRNSGFFHRAVCFFLRHADELFPAHGTARHNWPSCS